MPMVPRALACALVVIACGGDELLLPAEGEPATLAVVSGDGQTGPIGGQLAEALIVRVSDTRGRPIVGVDVAFAPDAGTVQPQTATTDADGLAATQWSLGMQTGTQQVNVSVAGASPPLSVSFTATASAGAARGLIIVSGNGQSAPAGSPLPAPLVVRLLDANGNPITGGEVSWVVGQGGGSVDPATSTTAADGTAAANWTLGPALGPNTLTAVVAGVGRVEFTATGTPGPAASLLLNGGNNQSAPAQSQLGTPLSVKAADASGNGVAGVAVTWAVASGGGSLSASQTTTGADGIAAVTWTLGSATGAQTVTASAAGLQGSPVTFTATATSSEPPPPPPPPTPDPSRSSLSANPTSFEAGNGSSTITVTARDAQGAPLSGVSVQLSVSGSGNSVNQPGTTNASGVATGSFTSSVAEQKTVSAAAGGVAIQQTATVTVTAAPPPPPPTPDPSRSSLSANPTSFEAGSGSSTITVTVRDAQGTPLSGVSVQLSVTGTGNSINPPGTTNGSGVATGSFTSTVAEQKTVSATAGGVAIQQTATVTVTAPPPPPPSSDASQTTADVPSGVAGSPTPITVRVRDASGAPITQGGDAVAVSVSGANNAGDLPVIDNNNGSYSASYTPELAGVDRVDITLRGEPIGGSPYTSTVLAASASQVGFLTQPGNERAGRAFRPPIEVAVQDRFANIVTSSSALITIAIAQGFDDSTIPEGTLTRSAVGGVATFDDLVITEAGDYTLQATAPGLEADESRAFGVRD